MTDCGDKVQCLNCPFKGKKCGTRGAEDSPFVIVGESPGNKELARGQPFVGPSGDLLNGCIPAELGLDPFVTNALQCMPRGKKDPRMLANAVRCCNERLLWEIKQHPRKVILALGNGALWGLTGNYDLKITQERGKLFESELAEIGIVACLHPAYLLRGGGSLKKFREDIAYAVQLATGKKQSDIKKHIVPKFIIPKTLKELDRELTKLEQYKVISNDTETSSLNPRDGYILFLGLAGKPDEVVLIPSEKYAAKWDKAGEYIDIYDPAVIERLSTFYATQKRKQLWQNGKFDVKWFWPHNIPVRVDEDIMLLSYALDETRGIHGLEQQASDLLGAPDYKDDLKQYLRKENNKSYEDVPFDVLTKYTAEDVSNTLQVYALNRPKVAADEHLEKLYTRTLIPASEFLAHVEINGFYFDKEWSAKNYKLLSERVEALEAQFQEIAGYDINPRSPIQVAKLLYDELRIPNPERTRSTKYEVLINLPPHEAVDALILHREAAKALSTYVVGMEEHVEQDGRIHATYNIHGTVTGRLSSSDPNLQNIPRDVLLRGAFRAAPGCVLLEFDYSQAELRSLTWLSKDPILLDIYSEGSTRSLHKELATKLFGKDYDEEQYTWAKAVNFGIVYGKTAYSLAKEFRISQSEAESWLEGWHQEYKVASEFIDWCRNSVRERRTMITLFGRKKRVGIVARENLNHLENEASNFPHQAIASDFTLHAGMKIRVPLIKLTARPVNIVHDCVVVETPNDPARIDAVIKLVIREMEQVPRDWGVKSVPFKAEVKKSINWSNKEGKTWEQLEEQDAARREKEAADIAAGTRLR